MNTHQYLAAPMIPPIECGGPAVLSKNDLRTIDRLARRHGRFGVAGYHARLALMDAAAERSEEHRRNMTLAHRAYIAARVAAGITARAYPGG